MCWKQPLEWVDAQWLPDNDYYSGTFQVIPVSPNGEYEPLERLQLCTLCYGKNKEKSLLG